MDHSLHPPGGASGSPMWTVSRQPVGPANYSEPGRSLQHMRTGRIGNFVALCSMGYPPPPRLDARAIVSMRWHDYGACPRPYAALIWRSAWFLAPAARRSLFQSALDGDRTRPRE